MKTKKQCPTCEVALASTTISSNLIAKDLIEEAQVYCFTRLPALEAAHASTRSNTIADVGAIDDDDVDDAAGKKRARAVPAGSGSNSGSRGSNSSSGTAAAKKAKSDHCTWTGKLQEAKQHFKECVYAGALCRYGCGAVVRRIDMSEHEASICPKREVQCTNVGCTAVMPETMIAAHKANDCLYEAVDCPFSSVGCKERVLRKDVESHEEAAMKQHNRLLLQDNRLLRQDNLSLQQKVAKQEETLNRQHQQIVLKVRLADLARDGVFSMESGDEMMGGYCAFMSVQKGYANNGDCCGIYLELADGPFPCRVSITYEVVHWDGEPESARKKTYTEIYNRAGCKGRNEFISLSKFTAAASPYVKGGHVTFIVTFHTLPLQ